MNRYSLRHSVTGEQIGRRHATSDKAQRAAKRASWRDDDCTVEVWWHDDTGKAKLCMGYAWHGVYTEIATISDSR